MACQATSHKWLHSKSNLFWPLYPYSAENNRKQGGFNSHTEVLLPWCLLHVLWKEESAFCCIANDPTTQAPIFRWCLWDWAQSTLQWPWTQPHVLPSIHGVLVINSADFPFLTPGWVLGPWSFLSASWWILIAAAAWRNNSFHKGFSSNLTSILAQALTEGLLLPSSKTSDSESKHTFANSWSVPANLETKDFSLEIISSRAQQKSLDSLPHKSNIKIGRIGFTEDTAVQLQEVPGITAIVYQDFLTKASAVAVQLLEVQSWRVFASRHIAGACWNRCTHFQAVTLLISKVLRPSKCSPCGNVYYICDISTRRIGNKSLGRTMFRKEEELRWIPCNFLQGSR